MEETTIDKDSIRDVDEGEPAGPPPRGGRLLRRRVILPAMLILLAVVVALGGRWYAYSAGRVSTDDAQIEPEVYPVSARIAGHVLRVKVDENWSVRAGDVMAEIDPRDYQVALDESQAALEQAQASAQAAVGTVSVTQRTGGAGISQAQASVASALAKQVMSESDRASALSQISSARAAERASQAAVEMARKDVSSARAAVTGAIAVADQAAKDATRMESLVKQGAVSTQARDAAIAQSVTAQASVQVAEARLSSAEAAVIQAQERARQSAAAVTQAEQSAGAAKAAIEQAKAAVRQAQAGEQSSLSNPQQVRVRRSEASGARAQVAAAHARLEQAKLNLSYTRVVAPIDGIVAAKNVQEGQYVQPGQSLFAIAPRLHTHILANFKETQLRKIRPGQKVAFTVDAYPGLTFRGRVESISPGTGSVFALLPPENASGNFTKVVQRVPVRIAVDERTSPQRDLRAGMSVVATIDVAKER